MGVLRYTIITQHKVLVRLKNVIYDKGDSSNHFMKLVNPDQPSGDLAVIAHVQDVSTWIQFQSNISSQGLRTNAITYVLFG